MTSGSTPAFFDVTSPAQPSAWLMQEGGPAAPGGQVGGSVAAPGGGGVAVPGSPDTVLEQAPPGGFFSNPWVLPAMLFGIFWFVVIGPERKAKRRRQEMLDGLQKGDRVLTTGGMFGTVAQIQEDGVVTLQVADGVRLKFARSAVQGITESDDA